MRKKKFWFLHLSSSSFLATYNSSSLYKVTTHILQKTQMLINVLP